VLSRTNHSPSPRVVERADPVEDHANSSHRSGRPCRLAGGSAGALPDGLEACRRPRGRGSRDHLERSKVEQDQCDRVDVGPRGSSSVSGRPGRLTSRGREARDRVVERAALAASNRWALVEAIEASWANRLRAPSRGRERSLRRSRGEPDDADRPTARRQRDADGAPNNVARQAWSRSSKPS